MPSNKVADVPLSDPLRDTLARRRHAFVVSPQAVADWESIHEWASTAASCRYQPWGRTLLRTQRGSSPTRSRRAEMTRKIGTCGRVSMCGLTSLVSASCTCAVGVGARVKSPTLFTPDTGAPASLPQSPPSSWVSLRPTRPTSRRSDLRPRNVASAAVLRKVGMTREGRVNLAASGGLGECGQYNLPASPCW